MDEYALMIKSFIKKDPNFNSALDLAKANSLAGDIWIVGSFLYKNILKEKYGLNELKVKDYDFMLDNQRDYSETIVPVGWSKKSTYYGGPRFFKGSLEVDVYPIEKSLDNFSLKHEGMNFEEMMRVYLRGTLFDIQSLAYNYSTGKIIDEGGLKAIKERKSKVICLDNCLGISKKKGMSLDEYLNYKSKSLGVKIIF